MLACLVTLRPLLSGSDRRATINLCSVADRRVTALGGTAWEPCITQAPAIGMQFWNGDFEQGTEAGKADFTFDLEQARKAHPAVINAVWQGALVEVAVGRVGAPAPWKTRFKGRVTSYAGTEYPAMKITASIDTEPFDVDVLGATYAGTTGIEGGADLKDKVKPLALGRPRNVEPVLINAVDSVYQFSAYGPIEAVETLFERASAFPAASADYPNYAALVAATIAPGHWATCLAQGLIRLGAPAAGVITGDIRGHVVGTAAPVGAGAIVKLLAKLCGVDSALVSRTRLDALDAEGATASDVMVTEQVSFLEAARRLILPCNWQVVISNTGVLLPMRTAIAQDVALVLHTGGRREPLCGAATEEAVSVPYKKTVMAAARSWRVHSFDEIATSAELIDRGAYDPATTYREGNIVSMPDGSKWEYVSTNPQAGVTPGTNPAVWAFMSGPIAASYYAQLSNESHTVAATSDGTVPSFAGAGGVYRVTGADGAPVSGFTFSVESETGVDVSIDPATGVYEVTGMSANTGTATLRATKDTITFDRVYSIAKAIAGQSAMNASALPAAVTVASTYNGTPKNGVPGFTVKCFLGEVDVTLDALGAVTSSGLTGVTHTGGGVFTVSGMSADTGWVEIQFSFGGAGTVLRVPYTKAKDGAPFVTGRAGIVTPGATTFGEVARVTLQMGPNGQVTADANGSFSKSGGGSLSVDGYFEVSLSGGSSWVTLPGTFTAEAAVGGADTGSYEGSAGSSGSALGLTTSQAVAVRLMMRRVGATFFGFEGQMAAQWAGAA
ncbi:hypothetical protein [Novosphingobium gossypii]|uniref:hypothetical protein n=1 Tax=Novosphingobium gossypii TaxID=1604774 RepID=UPI003D1ED7D0